MNSNRNKNSRELEAALRSLRDPGVCYDHAAGLCLGHELLQTPFRAPKCRKKHPCVVNRPPRTREHARYLDRIERFLDAHLTRKTQLLVTEKVETYLEIKRAALIHRLHSAQTSPQADPHSLLHAAQSEDARKREEALEKAGEKYMDCPVCPGRVPWSAKKRGEHVSSKIHRVFEKALNIFADSKRT